MEVELLWRRRYAKPGALRGGLRLLRLAEIVRYTEQLLVGHLHVVTILPPCRNYRDETNSYFVFE